MNNSKFHFLIASIGADIENYKKSGQRSRKIILTMVPMTYVSAFLSAYALFYSLEFIFQNDIIAWLLSICMFIIMMFHNQSLLSTQNTNQIKGFIVISLILACSFTISSNTKKSYDSIHTSLVTKVDNRNRIKANEKNEKLEAIEKEELEHRTKVAEAAKEYQTNRQSRADANRVLEGFLVTKQARVDRIIEYYESSIETPNISRIDILVEQSRKLLAGNAESLVAFFMMFCFWILECSCLLLRLLLNNSDYIRMQFENKIIVDNLSDQRRSLQLEFVNPESDLLDCLLEIDIIDQKKNLISTNFKDKTPLLILQDRKKIYKEDNRHPYTLQPLNGANSNINNQTSSESNSSGNQNPSGNSEQKDEDSIFGDF